MKLSKRLLQYITIILVNAFTLLILETTLRSFVVQSIAATIGVSIAFIASQVFCWWLFVNLFSSLPFFLYPLLTLILASGTFMLFGNLIPGVVITNLLTGLFMTIVLTLINAILGSLLSLDLESQFDHHVIRRLIARLDKPVTTPIPGFIFLEIDGLSERVFKRAMEEGFMPTLKRWHDQGSHKVVGWETDFTSQTGAMQPGILLGNNDNIPAYRWWSRREQRVVVSATPRDAALIEERLSNGRGLLSGGGASHSNMVSGDATESLFTFSTLLNSKRARGPGYYLYLLSPLIIAQLVTRFIGEVFKEWWQALRQRLRKDKYIVNARNLSYAFLRAASGPLLHDLTTYFTISGILRGLPAIYSMYVGCDDIAHYAGMETPESFGVLSEIDHYCARIERAIENAPRPYHFIILSDHGQSIGPTFHTKYGVTLEQLVKDAVRGGSKIFASLNTIETWDEINAFLSESLNAGTRTRRILRTMFRAQTQNGLVTFGPGRNIKRIHREQKEIADAQLIVLASGCTGLIYFTGVKKRMTYEKIQRDFPELIPSLTLHPGIGYVLVHSSEFGNMVVGKEGINFLDQGVVEGLDPLRNYSPNAAAHLRRESSFSNCPDIIVSTLFNPQTEELCSFENQVGHHGGLGGGQNFPFIYYPAELPAISSPVIGATSVYRILRGWRDMVQSGKSTDKQPI